MLSGAALPLDGQRILELAARSMFDLFANASEGMLLVDRDARVVWINEQYKRFLPALGFPRVEDFVGHPAAEVIQNTQMHRVIETGKPILIDLLSNKAGTFVVSRIPLRDEQGQVIGALGIVLFDHPETTLQPLIHKFAHLQRDLDEARRELATQRRSKYTLASFVGSSPAAVDVKRQARRAAQSASPVLLLGETGTGKELLAHAIHAASRRAPGPFVSVNIAAIPETLLEAEFFGVAPGAYTGADRRGRDGKFKLADGGTLFLDEIGDMPANLQPKLLRALQEGEIEPLGSNKVIRFDARVIAATSRDLAQLVREGRFREDLYYRLNVLPIRVPPLRERREDIPALVEVLAEDIAMRNGTAPFDLAPEAMAMLEAQAWRGNIRELRNIIEQAAMRCDSSHVGEATVAEVLHDAGIARVPPAQATSPQMLSPQPSAPQPSAPQPSASHGSASQGAASQLPLPAARRPADLRPLAEQVAELERDAIRAALQATGGNKLAAARLLGISRAKLYERLELPDFQTVA